jgi:hypothetical protein
LVVLPRINPCKRDMHSHAVPYSIDTVAVLNPIVDIVSVLNPMAPGTILVVPGFKSQNKILVDETRTMHDTAIL